MARTILEEEKLGQGESTDLLAVSFSGTDTVGHLYGPFSAESEDSLRMLDEELDHFLDTLDEMVGDDYLLVMTADHGVMPLPEWMVDQGEMQCPVDDGRILVESEAKWLYAWLYLKFTFPFGDPTELVGLSSAGLTVNADYAQSQGTSLDEVVSWLEEYYEDSDGVVAAWTQSELASSDDPFARLYQNSLVPGKSAHVIPQLMETCLAARAEGTTHGSPYLYDRAIPLVFYGDDVAKGRSAIERHSVDIAPTIAARLGLPMPENLDGEVLEVWEAETD